MKHVADWFRELRETLGISQDAMGARVGVRGETISRIETGRVKPSRSTLVLLSKELNLSKRQLIDFVEGRSDTPPAVSSAVPKTTVTIPRQGGILVLGRVTAGGMVESYEFTPERVYSLPISIAEVPQAFALEITGDSMMPLYQPGECVILRPINREELVDGEDAMIQLDGGGDGKSCFKRVVILGNGKLRLMPLNAKYDSIDVQFDHVVRVGRIVGKYTPGILVNPKGAGG